MFPRRIASITLALGLVVGIPGCFVLFPLDEYQEGPAVTDSGAPESGIIIDDARTDAPASAEGGSNDRLIFVTNGTFTGSLASQSGGEGGAAAGDAFCTDAGRRGGHAGTFKALLSDATVPAKSRVTDDPNKARPIVDSTGHKVAASIAVLFQNGPEVAINHTESGGVVEAGDGQCNGQAAPVVWTGANATGGRSDANPCSNWKSNAAGTSAQVGIATADKWLNAGCAVTCDKTAHLYCLQE